MVRYAIRLLDARPGLVAFGNLAIDHPRYEEWSWADLMAEDGPPGIRIYDEMAAAFESRRSMSLPLSWLNETRQLRKGQRIVLGTVQEFSMIDARWRSQTARVHRARARLRTLEKRDRVNDELLAGGHPRYISEQVWKGGKTGLDQKKDERIEVHRYRWSQLLPYATRYSSGEKIDLADHLTAQKDFYADKKGTP